MSSRERRDEWSMVFAIALIALGVLLLLGKLGPISVVISRISQFAWPLALIGLGLLLYFSARSASKPDGSGRRLYRTRDARMVGGVLSGVARYFGIDATLVRVVFVVFVVLTGVMPGVLLYIIAMFVVPEEPVSGAETAAAYVPTPPAASSSGAWSGWPHTGTETVQVPPPAEPPTPAGAPSEAEPSQEEAFKPPAADAGKD